MIAPGERGEEGGGGGWGRDREGEVGLIQMRKFQFQMRNFTSYATIKPLQTLNHNWKHVTNQTLYPARTG